MGEATAGVSAVMGEAEARVAALGPTLRRIELGGALPEGWAGRLASGLAAQRVNIVRGWAREQGARWEAQLEVEIPDYLDLTPGAVLQLTAPEAAPPRSGLAGLELLEHRVTWSGPDLLVELKAADGRGFLDRTLRLFALHGLFPREMQVETADGMVQDAFRLRSAHGDAPGQATVAALESRLERLTVP
jgi:hypothetical protein